MQIILVPPLPIEIYYLQQKYTLVIVCFPEIYIADIQTGLAVSNTEPSVVKETVATALVDGNNTLGPVVGNFSMDLAIQKAKDVGIGWVAAKGEIFLDKIC